VYHRDIEAENARIEERPPKICENERAQCYVRREARREVRHLRPPKQSGTTLDW
jgi:hypothetical protein